MDSVRNSDSFEGKQKNFMTKIWVFPKIVGFPPNHPMFNRVFPYFHHPFWGKNPPHFGSTSKYDPFCWTDFQPDVRLDSSSLPAAVHGECQVASCCRGGLASGVFRYECCATNESDTNEYGNGNVLPFPASCLG